MSMELREEYRRREREAHLNLKEREDAARDLRAVATTPEGVRLLRRLLNHGGIFRADYEPGTPGAYRAGKKAAALELWQTLRESLPLDAFVDIALAADDTRDDHAADFPAEFSHDHE